MKYRALIEQATDAVYVVELNEDNAPSRFIEVNPVGCRRFGYSRRVALIIIFKYSTTRFSNNRKVIRKIKKGQTSFTLQDEYVFQQEK